MAEPNQNQVESQENNQQPNGMEADYLAAIKEMKASSVSKAEYDKLKEENRNLLKSLIEGQPIEAETPEEPVDVQKLRNELFDIDNPLNNLEYITKSLQLRKAVIESGGVDPFLPQGKNIAPTSEDIEAAERAAQVYAECVEYADGDNSVFTNELMRRTRDVRMR